MAQAKQKLLLERTGAVTNLGGNYFSLTFPSELTAFAAESIAPGQNKLSTGVPLPGRIEGGEHLQALSPQALNPQALSQ